jgi:hypothetical protein
MFQNILIGLMVLLVISGIVIGIITLLPPMSRDQEQEVDTTLKPGEEIDIDIQSNKLKVEKTRDITPTPAPEPSVPQGCYDILTMRDGAVYLFQSYAPLQEGTNPKIFSDLPTYRVWTEHFLQEGIRCPVLFYDASQPAYYHPEEEVAGDVPMVRTQIANGQRKRYEVLVKKTVGFDESKPYANLPVGTGGDPEYDFYKQSRQSKPKVEGFLQETRMAKNQYLRNAMTDPIKNIGQDGVETDYIMKSRYDGLGIGYDDPLPDESVMTLRDVPKKEIDKIIRRRYPDLHGVKTKRVGISKYQIEEITPERETDDPQNPDTGEGGHWTAWGKQMPLDLLAYGGTVVPSGSVFDTIFGKR